MDNEIVSFVLLIMVVMYIYFLRRLKHMDRALKRTIGDLGQIQANTWNLEVLVDNYSKVVAKLEEMSEEKSD